MDPGDLSGDVGSHMRQRHPPVLIQRSTDLPDSTAVVVGSDDSKLNYDPLRQRLDLANGSDDVRNRFCREVGLESR